MDAAGTKEVTTAEKMVAADCSSSRARWWSIVVTLFMLAITDGEKADGSPNMAGTPPRGWNSYDSFSWVITETEFLQNAQVVADELLPFGYEYVVVDFLWYRKLEPNASAKTGRDSIDQYGRPQPDPERWPSSQGGQGFKHVADRVHQMGLKLGIHVMRGINLAAVASNLSIHPAQGSPDETGRRWTTSDIAVQGGECPWMPQSFTRVDTGTVGGQSFLQSLYNQYADWGVDLVKHDCIFGGNLVLDEIATVSKAIANTGRPMVYSVSPGDGATPAMGQEVAQLVNMYRVSTDNWDNWNSVQPHFNIARDFANAGSLGVAQTQGGRSWPDQDMLPFGLLTLPGKTAVRACQDDSVVVDRPSQLMADEQRAQMTLWAISKSPLFYGGDLRYLDAGTRMLLTNSAVLDMNARSTLNQELRPAEPSGETRVWVALDPSGGWFVALFNLGSSASEVSASLYDIRQALGGGAGSCACTGEDVWRAQPLGAVADPVRAEVAAHGVALYALTCAC